MLSLDSKCQEYYELCLKTSACGDAIEWLAKLLKEVPDITIGETFKMINVFLTDDMRELWAVWNLKNLGSEFDDKMTDIVISYVKTPIEAARLHIECSNITTAQDEVLKNVFKDKLPTIEKELADKVVVPVDKMTVVVEK